MADKIDLETLRAAADDYADAHYPDRNTGRTRQHIRDEHFARLVMEDCAKEAEHWQTISRPEHKCGEYIAAAIRSMKP